MYDNLILHNLGKTPITYKRIWGQFMGILHFPKVQSISNFFRSVTEERQRKMAPVAAEIFTKMTEQLDSAVEDYVMLDKQIIVRHVTQNFDINYGKFCQTGWE